jgi:hypothetical protein
MSENVQSLATVAASCPDLIRASIHLRKMHYPKMMDCRVKPGNDEITTAAT